VNNAGAIFDIEEGDSASILATSKEALTRSFETNTIGAVLTAQALVPLMKKTGYGRIVNVSSGMGGITEMNGGYPGYRLSKAALNASTRVLSEELKGDNIKVNALCPGWVRTDMGGEDAHLSPEEGVDTTVYLSTLPDDGPTGAFFRKRAPILW
jgi:NAD(P)-dependent dehydrogenase (short-subunit alcohol dehydrogenase family)